MCPHPVDKAVDEGQLLWIALRRRWTVARVRLERESRTRRRFGRTGWGGNMDAVADIEVRRSARRRRTVSAYREGGRIIVLIPARFSRREEDDWVGRMVRDVEAREDRARRRGPGASDDALLRRATDLSRRYLNGLAVPASIRWVDTMAGRWGSCTTVDRTIRISSRLREFPPWVVDYVILHELAHILTPGHGPDFWALTSRYESTERARGFLHGHSVATRSGLDEDSW